MAASDRNLQHRGNLTQVLGRGDTLLFTTVHPEGQATALYRLKPDKGELQTDALPCGGLALLPDGERVLLLGTDARLYSAPIAAGAPTPLGGPYSPAPKGLALLKGGRIALVGEQKVLILDGQGALLQELDLSEPGTVIASDPSGTFFVVGTERGSLAVFDCEEKERFLAGETTKVHEGAVTTLHFEAGELRVLSGGADKRLFTTHVRGKLEPEDRGGGANHDQPIRAMLLGPEEHGAERRFYTVGDDGNLKAWPTGAGRKRPTTTRDGIAKSVSMTFVAYKERQHLVLALDGGTLRLIAVDAAGKVGDPVINFRGALDWAKAELAQSEPKHREAALQVLAGWNDGPSIELLANQARSDNDHSVRAQAARLLADSGNRRAHASLKGLLSSETPAVRLHALDGLRALDGQQALEPLDWAIAARKPDLGKVAVSALAQLAKKDDLAMERLLQALNAEPSEVRAAALAALEGHYKADEPTADLLGLRSQKGDLRRLALIRLHQREMAALPEVSMALRRHGEDSDADVRLTAFLVSVSARPLLTEALRGRDKDLARQIFELETWGKPDDPDRKPPKTRKVDLKELSDSDLRPLLEAMASRAQDTCLRGATGLASLQDPRALGALLLLSRETEAPARVSACRALETLGDNRALNRLRLMIRDAAPEVRDAAFSALSRLEEGPLAAAEAGLAAEHEDVRRRGLQSLLARLRANPDADTKAGAHELLRRALNDAASLVRTEAFKAVVNLNVGGGGADSLRFALSSLHADVRREVLTETMARFTESWAWPMLLELFNDPEESIRREAFEFANKKGKGRKLEPLAAGLKSRYPDQRERAARELTTRRNEDALDLLVQALDDNEVKVRGLAIEALVAAEAHQPLLRAMASIHPDVRARAACARAALGDLSAMPTLLELVSEPKPEPGKGDPGAWEKRVVQAANGLGALGAVEALGPLAPLLERPEGAIRLAAAEALAWVARPGQVQPLLNGLRHADESVRIKAALGLAFNGDPAGVSILFSRPAAPAGKNAPKPQVIPEQSLLHASLALGEAGRANLLGLLDSPTDNIRRQAIAAVMLLDLAEGGDPPTRLLSAVSADSPDVRLAAAESLETFPIPAAYDQEVLNRLNQRPEGQLPWKLGLDVVLPLAGLLSSSDAQLRARAAIQLQALNFTEQDDFDRAWRALTERLGAARLQAAADEARAKAAAAPRSDNVELKGLVIGAYVGLSRKGTARQLTLRTQALTRLLRMAEADRALVPTVEAALVLSLNDQTQQVRQFAFDGLKRLGMSTNNLGAEALASPHRDVGTLGLTLLSEDAGGEAGLGLLRKVVAERTDGLQSAALELYSKRAGEVAAGLAALDARDPSLAEQGVTLLARSYSADPRAPEGLRSALRSRHPGPRLSSALRLAEHKDPQAFDGLLSHLRSDEARAQSAAISALSGLGDARVPDALMDRVRQDPNGSARVDELLGATGQQRDPASFARLMGFTADKRTRQAALKAALAVTGYDQRVESNDEDGVPGEWVKRQHPRRDELFAELLRVAMDLGEDRFVRNQLPGATWCFNPLIDAQMARFTTAVESRLRVDALEAVGWRLRRRKGPAEPLLRALEAQDAETRFLAAEGLALAGRSEGVAVLLAAVELMPELNYRQRAVNALGPLADSRSLELLLRVATEEAHALQENAAEAIGYMGRGPRSEDILKALLKLAENDSNLGCKAIAGLRHFNTEPGWAAVRGRAQSGDWRVRQAVAEALEHDPSPAAQDVLFKLVNDNDSDVSGMAVGSLRKRLGPDSVEPDLAQARSSIGPSGDASLRRIREKATATQLFTTLGEVQSHLTEEWFEPLAAILLNRGPAPVAEAVVALSSPKDAVVEIAARVLSQGGTQARAHAAQVSEIAHRTLDQLAQGREDQRYGRSTDLSGRVDELARVAMALVRASGRLGGDASPALRAATLTAAHDAPLRRAALLALAEGLGGAEGLKALRAAATGPDAEARALGAAALRALDPKQAAALLEGSLDDPGSLARLLSGDSAELSVLRGGASRPERLGAVLPHLVQRQDVAGLAAVFANRALPEAVRYGAAEGLGRIPNPAVDEALLVVARAKDEDEDIKKAAWKALRRARRLRTQAPVEVRG